ncbi:MAG: integrase [Planctomycetes bacterium]|nr:integrase [Planctomycetota bacterium]
MSTLQNNLQEYLRVRRSLGLKLRDVDMQLSKFVSFLERQGLSHITTEATLSWLEPMSISPSTKASRWGMVRHFAQYVSALDPQNEVPPSGLLPGRYCRKQPYIYSDGEIAQLLHAAQQIPWAGGFKAKTYSTFFGLLIATGMRVGEALSLNDQDVDLEEGILTLNGTKFHKSRLVPVHPSTREKLRQYARCRNQLYPRPKSPSFFVSTRGTRLLMCNVWDMFIRLSCQIGLRKPSDRHGPRLHDFRHRFAVKTLLDWYRTGVDVEQHIAELSTYLGHGHPSCTYWYLSATPELLRRAAMRVDHQRKGWTS